LANLQAADRSLDRLSERISALRAGFQMHAQDKTNRKLGMLTILSAIFMPITLLAGIGG
jgi:Mg2+ and Co2+ transporter CorA